MSAIVSLGLGALGCPQRLWYPGIDGKVVDSETGEAIPGAEIFVSYRVEGFGSGRYNTRWGTSDEHGEFSIPGELDLTISPPFVWLSRYPFFVIVHPSFGLDVNSFETTPNFPDYGNAVLRIREDTKTWDKAASDPREYSSYCGFVEGEEACDRMCEVVYGSVEACDAAGRRRLR